MYLSRTRTIELETTNILFGCRNSSYLPGKNFNGNIFDIDQRAWWRDALERCKRFFTWLREELQSWSEITHSSPNIFQLPFRNQAGSYLFFVDRTPATSPDQDRHAPIKKTKMSWTRRVNSKGTWVSDLISLAFDFNEVELNELSGKETCGSQLRKKQMEASDRILLQGAGNTRGSRK